MAYRDLHSSLKSEIVAKANKNHLEAVVVRLQWSKQDIAYSLHVNPTSYTPSGLQKSDFLSYLGFQRADQCTFTSFQRCYVKQVTESFDPQQFVDAFERAYVHLGKAEGALGACGFLLPQPEGWGFFMGTSSGRSSRGHLGISGDAHTARKTEGMKQTEDDIFLFRFSFVDTGSQKGFVTHYRPKHPPLSSEISDVLRFLNLKEFGTCPEFDFEPCFYRSLQFESRGDSYFDSNTQYAHSCFGAHETQFSSGIRELLSANEEIERLGMTFLPITGRAQRLQADIERKIIRPDKPAPNTLAKLDAAKGGVPSNFDVAISVAGTEKSHASELANKLKNAGFAVFYYEFYPEYLWGKNLAITFDEIFRKRSRFCVMFVSKEYRDRVWTSHEMRSAQARAVEEKGSEYILPIRVDDTELDGLLPTVGYVSLSAGIDTIADILIKKLKAL